MTSNQVRGVGKNVTVQVEGNVMTIKVNLSERHGKSKKGEGPNEIVATTGGIQKVPGHPALRYGFNVFEKAEGTGTTLTVVGGAEATAAA